MAGRHASVLLKSIALEELTCAHCHKSLVSGGYSSVDGRLYCTRDYGKLFANAVLGAVVGGDEARSRATTTLKTTITPDTAGPSLLIPPAATTVNTTTAWSDWTVQSRFSVLNSKLSPEQIVLLKQKAQDMSSVKAVAEEGEDEDEEESEAEAEAEHDDDDDSGMPRFGRAKTVADDQSVSSIMTEYEANAGITFTYEHNLDHFSPQLSILSMMCEILVNFDVHETSLFQACFYPAQVDELVKAFNDHQAPEQMEFGKYSLSSLATAVKRILRIMEPLFPFRMYQEILDVKLSGCSLDTLITSYRVIVDGLPFAQRTLLHLLFSILSDVAGNEEVTLMSTEKLAYTFGPILLRCKKMGTDLETAVAQARICNEIVEDMILHHSKLFTVPEVVVFVDKSTVKQCSKCTTKFSILKKKKQCERCGRVFCKKCTMKDSWGLSACLTCLEYGTPVSDTGL